MRNFRKKGKVVGEFNVKTSCADYSVEVRFDVGSNRFVAYLPGVGDEVRGESYEGLKKEVRQILGERDTTTFHDVLECRYQRRFSHDTEGVYFSFKVRRVSEAVDSNGNPRLEIDVVVSEDGEVSVREFFGDPSKPHNYSREGNVVVPYTVARWRLCCQIESFVASAREALEGLLGEGVDAATRMDAAASGGARLLEAIDALNANPLRVGAVAGSDEESS